MSTPSIVERIFSIIETLISDYEDDDYIHAKLMELHSSVDDRSFSTALTILRKIETELNPTDPQRYAQLENELIRIVRVKERVERDEQLSQLTEPKKRKPEPKKVLETFRPSLIKVGREYRVTLVNTDSEHRKDKKMKKVYKMLDDGTQIWTLQQIGVAYYTFDTIGSINSLGLNVAIEDVDLEEVTMTSVPEPSELLDGMLIQVQYEGYPLLTQMYRHVMYAESPVIFVTYNTRTPVITTPFDASDPEEEWNYPSYLDLTKMTEIEVLDCGQYAEEIKPLKPMKGSKVNVCVAKLNTGEMRVLIPFNLSGGDLSRTIQQVSLHEHVETTDFVECKVSKVGKTTCTLERYGEVPLGCILGVWRDVDISCAFESVPGVTPHLWTCEWTKNKHKFVLDLYYTEIRLRSQTNEETWVVPLDEEEDDDALEEGETYDYFGVEYVCEGKSKGESKTEHEDIVYVLKDQKTGLVIYKTADEIHDQIMPKFELFDKYTKQYVLFKDKLWKVKEFNVSDRTYMLEHDDGSIVHAFEKDIAPEPILTCEIGQLVGFEYEFYKVYDNELVYDLVCLDQTNLTELDKHITGIPEVALDQWCMFKQKIVRLKMLENGEPDIEQLEKKGKMTECVKIFEKKSTKRPKTVIFQQVTFQPDIGATFVQERWHGQIKKNTRVIIDTKDGEKKGIVIGWRESDKAEHATSDKYEIKFNDDTREWHPMQKVYVDPTVVEEEEEEEQEEEKKEEWSGASESESESDSESDAADIDDEFDGELVQIHEVIPSGVPGEQVRYDDGFDSEDDEDVVLNIVRAMNEEDLYVVTDGKKERQVYKQDLTLVIQELNGVEILPGEVFHAELVDESYKLTSCWRDIELTVPSICLTSYVPDLEVDTPVYLKSDETYTRRVVGSTLRGLYQLRDGTEVKRTEIDVYRKPFEKKVTVCLNVGGYEVYTITNVQGRKVDLRSTWDPSKTYVGVDMNNVSRWSEEYEPGDFVKVRGAEKIYKVNNSTNNRVSLVGISGKTYSPDELEPSEDPSTQENSDIEDSSDDDSN